MSFVNRYRAGEQEQVWAELLALGESIREKPLFNEAYAVAYETMSRVRTNVELLVPRLQSIGYEFGIYPDGSPRSYHSQAHIPPAPDISIKIATLEELVGTLPLSLRVFWEVVGSVAFIGYHPDWPDYSDPLVVDPFDQVDAEYEYWKENCEDYGLEEVGPFELPIAPDSYHKDNVSGGPPYGIIVPNSTIDAKLENESHETTFVDYLRVCFRSGGFPGQGPLPVELADLTRDLLPI
ncbi:hypothetical protein K9N68_15505 [Kovacikia minuta CCNUW1]|uniref:hypothetical protein n=1 Tax=Kovacikia minuta TaxID=2931930 RepID=UPI001CCFE7FB|nr:hypothetical protein [Kovacikia minuta]UBF29113.1 hypothetical protein K9N68_15505 [Kovacikia minuta CCNUW1]